MLLRLGLNGRLQSQTIMYLLFNDSASLLTLCFLLFVHCHIVTTKSQMPIHLDAEFRKVETKAV